MRIQSLPKRLAALAGFLLAISCLGPPTATGQSRPPTYEQLVKEGAVLAERLCSSCHLVERQAADTANAGVPSIRGIANRPGQSAARIRNILINPHPPMPDVRLSYPEIDRLIAYIDSLRSEAAGGPLVPRVTPRAKPEYPDPS